MSVVEPGSAGAGLVARVKDILTKPSPTWDVIDGERPTVGQLYTGYIAPLAAIPAVCGAVGMAVLGAGAMGITVKLSPASAVTQAVVSFVLSLVMVYVVALIIDGLAPTFGGQKDRLQALKVAAYASTASWVAGVFSLIPMLGIVGLLGALYSLFLLSKGLPRLMKTPEEKAVPYTVVVVVIAVVLGLVIGMVTGAVTSMTGGGRGALGDVEVSGKVNIPGAGEVDVAKLEALGKALEKGEPGPVSDPDALKGYLPGGFAGFTRGDVSTGAGGVGAIQGAQAEAEYSRGDSRITLEVTDAGGAAALVGLAGAFNARSSKETATGYEKMGQVDGRLTQESYDREARRGEYGVLVGQRFWVRAQGDGVTMDELKSAVAAVGLNRLEAAAKAD
ncbi:Yip1 family protein [Phenylobacterium sp.]|uniref:Yip1 family protein n=1 Tax=Phenylobacterium sp. TaxID=1871053 RepID=UPI00301BFFDB